MKYLIAGGAGFIGSHLTERLVNLGHTVSVVDNLVTGSLDNIEKILDRIEFFECDIADFETDDKYDIVFHLASIANTTDYMRSKYEVLRSSSFGTDNILRISQSSSARFFYFSSSEIYGHSCTGFDVSVNEDSFSDVALLNERSPYFVGKMFSEEYVRAFCEMNHLEYMIVRPFNIYGSRMDSRSPYGRVMTNFFRQAASNQPMTINGDGEQTRSFCHIDDFIDAIILTDKAHKWKHNVMNIGNPEAVSINGLAEKVSSLFGKGLSMKKCPAVAFEPRHRKPDIGRISEWLGWVPKIKINDGLLDVFQKGHSHRV